MTIARVRRGAWENALLEIGVVCSKFKRWTDKKIDLVLEPYGT